MPNWCYNYTIFKFETEELMTEFEVACKNNNVFSKYAPIDEPNSIKRIDKWGTKWEPTDIVFVELIKENLRDRGYQLCIQFSTAWNPPLKFYKFILENHNIESTSFFVEKMEMFFGESFHKLENIDTNYYKYPKAKENIEYIKTLITPELFDFMEDIWYDINYSYYKEDIFSI